MNTSSGEHGADEAIRAFDQSTSRISVTGWFGGDAVHHLRVQGLVTDFHFRDLRDISARAEALQRLGFGSVLAVFGAARMWEYEHEDATWRLPGLIEELGIPRPSLVYVPMSREEANHPRTERIRDELEEVLDISKIFFHPATIVQEGVKLVKAVVERKAGESV